jgi:hypothetical protein
MPLLEIGELYQLGSGGLDRWRWALVTLLAPMAACFRETAMHDNTAMYGQVSTHSREFIARVDAFACAVCGACRTSGARGFLGLGSRTLRAGLDCAAPTGLMRDDAAVGGGASRGEDWARRRSFVAKCAPQDDGQGRFGWSDDAARRRGSFGWRGRRVKSGGRAAALQKFSAERNCWGW